MGLGFVLALVAGFVWSVNNVIDKIVLHKLVRSPLVQLCIFTTVSFVIGLAMLPFTGFEVSGGAWFYYILAGAGYVFGTWFYFKALQHEEPSRVVPLLSLAIVFIAILSAFTLGEVFSLKKYIGIAAIAIGSFVISSKRNPLKVFRSSTVRYMVASTLIYSVAWVAVKHLLESYTYLQVFAYQRLIIGLIGFGLAIGFAAAIRHVVAKTPGSYLGISVTTEVLGESGALLFTAASAVWFITLVETVASVQYLFIFVWGIIISRFKPTMFRETLHRPVLIQKMISIILIIGGVYLVA